MPLPSSRIVHPRWVEHAREHMDTSFPDTCTIRHPGGTAGTFDPETGNTPTVPYPAHYSGPCAAEDDPTAARELLVAEQEVTLAVTVVRVPWSVTDVAEGDLVTVTDSADPVLVARGEMTVTDVQASTSATYRRLLCTSA